MFCHIRHISLSLFASKTHPTRQQAKRITGMIYLPFRFYVLHLLNKYNLGITSRPTQQLPIENGTKTLKWMEGKTTRAMTIEFVTYLDSVVCVTSVVLLQPPIFYGCCCNTAY